MFNTDYYTSRFFNEVRVVGDLVVKSSTNKTKITSEFNFYYLLPANLQRFFIQPFDLCEESDRLMYSMEHVSVPSSAKLLLNGTLSEDSFFRFLQKISAFREECLEGEHGLEAVQQQSKQLVLDKTIKRLAPYPEYGPSIDRLVEAYEHFKGNRLVWKTRISHGDLCLSNALWIGSVDMLKLIDPRGANHKEDLYLDEYYDLAKLQHSLVSGYESILYEGGSVPAFAKDAFGAYLNTLGVSVELLKVYEAALFLSMIPLHKESQSRMNKFYNTATTILDELGV